MENKILLYKKLHDIQKIIIGLGKDTKGNNYQYVSGDKVLSNIRPLMDEKGLLLKQEILSIDNQRMDYKTGIGTKYEKPKSEILSKVMMKFTWVDTETGETDVNLFGSNGQNDWEKGLGSALTYAERYFLLKFFHISTDEDDIDNPQRKEEEEKERQKLEKEAKKLEEEGIKALNNCKTISELGEVWVKFNTLQSNTMFSKTKDLLKTQLNKK